MSTVLIAHRGASHLAPENTLPAIQKAVAAGAGMIYLDVQVTRDQELVVFADSHLDRTTNTQGRIAQKTLAEVQALDAGSWFGEEFAGARVPTLAEALAEVGGKTQVLLMLPELRAGSPLLAKLQAALAGRTAPAEDVLVAPGVDTLKAVQTALPAFGAALLLGEKVEGWVVLEKSARLGLKVIRPYRKQITPKLVRDAHAKGVRVLAYFADDESELKALLEAKVDGIVTGRLERLQGLLAKG